MLSTSLKALNIILMCFDGKRNHLKKKKRERERESTAIVMVKECRKV